MKFYTITEKEPRDGQVVICECPGWCRLGYQVAEWDNKLKEFTYPECSNDTFNDLVYSWAPLSH